MSSFDVLGSREKSVAIVEITEDKVEKEKEIAELIMSENKNIKSVLRKDSSREGEYRTRSYTLIAGNEDTEITHKEHGYSLRLDPRKTYFSVREGTERQRIASKVKEGETVMVMFAGVGPYAIAIAKKQPDVEKVIAIEINEPAVEYMKTNVRINKLSHKIIPILGDVKEKCEKWYGKCDRIIMPLPMSAEDFLEDAVKCAKPGAIIHFYTKGNKDDLYSEAERLISERLKKTSTEYKIMDRRIVLPYSPKTYKVCVEVKVV